MVSAVYLLHWPDCDTEYLRCTLLMHRSYHNDVPDAPVIISEFKKLYRQLQPHERTPFLYYRGVNYMYIWGANDILVLAAAKNNVNAMLTVTLLHQFYLILQHYCVQSQEYMGADGQTNRVAKTNRSIDMDDIVDNFSLIYELLDECIDFGVVQLTDYNILKEYIKMRKMVGSSGSNTSDLDVSDSGSDSETPKASKKGKSGKKTKQKDVKSTRNHADKSDVVDHKAEGMINSSIVRTLALAISWRPKGIFYPKNEIYIDIIEESEFLYDLERQTVKTNEIKGVCVVRSYLSGMPSCKLGLNEKYISQVENDELDEEEEIEQDAISDRPDNLLAKSAESEELSSEQTRLRKRLKVPINNVQFHQCIELSSIYKDNLIMFTPPDGEFQLLAYTVDQQRRKDKLPLIMVAPVYRIVKSESKLQVMCSLSTTFKQRLHCRNLAVSLPVDPTLFTLNDNESGNFRFKAELGSVCYKVDTSEILWTIDDLPGSKKTVRMMAEILLSDCQNIDSERIRLTLLHSQLAATSQTNLVEDDSALADLDKLYGVHGVNKSVFNELQHNARSLFDGNDIRIGFELPLVTYSGLRVTYLGVDETGNYTCFPWVRYLTQASRASEKARNGYRFRMGPKCFEVA